MDFYHSKEPTVIYPRDIATEAETAALEHADRLAVIIGKHWHPTNDADRDDVMLLVADLLPELAHLVSWWMLWRAWVRSGGRGSAAVRVCPAMLMVMVR